LVSQIRQIWGPDLTPPGSDSSVSVQKSVIFGPKTVKIADFAIFRQKMEKLTIFQVFFGQNFSLLIKI